MLRLDLVRLPSVPTALLPAHNARQRLLSILWGPRLPFEQRSAATGQPDPSMVGVARGTAAAPSAGLLRDLGQGRPSLLSLVPLHHRRAVTRLNTTAPLVGAQRLRGHRCVSETLLDSGQLHVAIALLIHYAKGSLLTLPKMCFFLV